jgi:hypothetical protein
MGREHHSSAQPLTHSNSRRIGPLVSPVPSWACRNLPTVIWCCPCSIGMRSYCGNGRGRSRPGRGFDCEPSDQSVRAAITTQATALEPGNAG